MKGSWLNNPCRGPEDNEDAERDAPGYADLLRRLRANLDKYPGFVNLNSDAATAIETLLAQQKVLVEEVEAARHVIDGATGKDYAWWDDQPTYNAARSATDAAFPQGLPK